MARIRTIKPDFWTDEALTECSLSARLLFIGLLNFADDNGNLERSAKKIKMQVFPADVLDCEPLIIELIANGVLTEYSVRDKKYLNIKGFKKHQVINRPSKTNIPEHRFTDDSVSAHVSLTDGREGKGREGNKELSASPVGEAPPVESETESKIRQISDAVPYQSIVEAYNRTMEKLPKVREINTLRKTAVRVAWQASQDRRSLEFWTAYFEECAEDNFLNGTGPYTNGHEHWRPDFDYLMKPKVITRTYERALDRMERSA